MQGVPGIEGGIVALSGKRPLQVQSSVHVRYSETDQMGVVYYANYLVWFEIGRTDYCRQMGFAYKAMEEEDGLFISVAEVKCRYRAPAHYDDELTVRTCLQSLRKRVLVFGYEICRENGDEILATGESVHVITNRDGRPRTLPDKYYRLFLKAAHEEEESD